MTAKSLDVFSLRDTVLGEYKKFATSFTTIFAEDIRRQVEAIYAKDRFWPEPLIQINPSFKRTTTIDKLVAEGVLEANAADISAPRPRRMLRVAKRSRCTSTRNRPSRLRRRAKATSSPQGLARGSLSASSFPSSTRCSPSARLRARGERERSSSTR